MPFQRVVLAAAGKGAERAALVFALDKECAHIARVAREPIMAQIRLAWWRDALTGDDLPPEHRTDMTQAIRALPDFAGMRAHLVAMIDGWEELIVDDGADRSAMLDRYARGRGGGLFGALAPDIGDAGNAAGRIWALWDLAGHAGSAALAEAAIEAARAIDPNWRGLPRMLAMMAGVAAEDITKGKGAPAALTPGLYFRLLRIQFFGR